MRAASWLVTGAAAAGVGLLACPLSLDEYGTAWRACLPDCGADGLAADGRAPDAPALDAAPNVCNAVSTGSVATATGLPQQTHVFFVPSSGLWWLFYIDDDAMHLKAVSSSDFCTWSNPTSIALPATNAGEGRNFSLAYKNIDNTDVVHITVSHRVSDLVGTRSHGRVTLMNSMLVAPAAPSQVASIAFDAGAMQMLPPFDGTVTGIDGQGYVTDFSGWTIEAMNGQWGDSDAWRSTSPDTGLAGWAGGFAPFKTIGGARSVSNARHVEPFGTQGLLALWSFLPTDGTTNGIYASLSDAGSWPAVPTQLLADAGSEDAGEWTFYKESDTKAHLVRRASAGSLDYLQFDGSGFASSASPPTLTGASGVFLAGSASGLLLYSIASDGTIMKTRYDGSAWSAWQAFVQGTGATRQHLAGYASGGRAALLWMEGTGTSYGIVGTLLP